MSRRLRSSKVRHVFCDLPKDIDTWSNFTLDSTMGEHNFINASNKYFALSVRGGGGPVIVGNLGDKPGKFGDSPATLNGHKDAVLDMAFNPFDDGVLATGSKDCKICTWRIPEGGLKESQHTPLQCLGGHRKKVTLLEFHPTSSNVLTSADANGVIKLWDIEKGEAQADTGGMIEKAICCLQWNQDGSQLFTSAKDKFCRMFDPRVKDPVVEWKSHVGAKAVKGCFIHDWNQLITTGCNKQAKREVKIFDLRKLSNKSALVTEGLDSGAGHIMPFFDQATKLLYLGGKGDGNIRIFGAG